MKNVTPALGGTGRGPAAAKRPALNPILLIAVAVVLVFLLLRACAHHENTYEKIAHDFTTAVQANDLAKVDTFENAQTRRSTNHARVGKAADTLAPLGKIKEVKENTPSGAPAGGHEFLVTFDKGTATEKIVFDPDNKIVSFNYELGNTAKP